MYKRFSRCLSLMLVGILFLSACNKRGNEEVVTSDLGMDIIGEPVNTLPTLPELAETSESYILTTESFSETTTVTTEISTETSTETSLETNTETTSVPSTSIETTKTVLVTTEVPTTSLTTVGTTEEILLPFIDVTAGTTVTEPVIKEESVNSNGLRDLSSILNTKNTGKAWWYTQFNENEKQVYNNILSAVIKHQPTVEFNEVISLEQYSRIYGIVYGQNPELFWMSGKTKLSDDGKSATLFYTYDEKTSSGMQIVLDKRVKELLDMMTSDMTELEKLLLCHNYIVKFNSYSKDTKHATNAYGCIIDGKSQCSGYAKGFLYLCNQLNIPCIYVNGISGETGNTHAWNQVLIEGSWYNVDCMWDDPEMEPEDKKNVSYRYMGVPDALIMGNTHLFANRLQSNASISYFKLPECTAYSENADIRFGVYATTYEEIYEKLKQGCLTAVKEGRYCAHVKVESTAVYKEALEKLFANKEVYNIRKEINSQYGEGYVVGFGAAPENKLNYIEVTLKYGEGYAP